MGQRTAWWTWVRDWAAGEHARLEAFLHLADTWPRGRLGPGALGEMDLSPREGLASLLEDARALGRERFLKLMDALVPPQAPDTRRTIDDVAALWMAAEPLYRQWERRTRAVADAEAPGNDVRLLHECGGVLPWVKHLKNNKNTRGKRQLDAIRGVYEAGAGGASTPDAVMEGVYWAATRARNERAHGATLSEVRGRVDALELHRDVVALLVMGYLRHRRWIVSRDGDVPPLAEVACVDEGPERLPLRPSEAAAASGRSRRCCRWLPVVMLVAVVGALGALGLSYMTPARPGASEPLVRGQLASRHPEAPKAASDAAPSSAAAASSSGSVAATACGVEAQALVGRWSLATMVGHAWEGVRCAVGTRGYYDLEISASREDADACVFKVWITKRGYVDSCHGDRVHDYGKKPRDGAVGRLVRLSEGVGGGSGASALLARLDVGADRGQGSGRRYLFAPCGEGRLCGFWQTRGDEWRRYGYSGFLVARRAEAGGAAARDVARALSAAAATTLPVKAVRCMAQCATGVVAKMSEDADEHWERCRMRCGVSRP